MTRYAWCAECGKKYPEAATRLLLYPRSAAGEPAEYGRIVKGLAVTPSRSQRTMYINSVPHELSLSQFECDHCSAAILPGQPMTCLTIWHEDQPVPPAWESDYLQLNGEARR